STPVGEGDIKPTPSGRIVVDFLKKKFPAYVDTGLNLVDAMECARGHIAALEKGRSGERYILGGENLTLKQILDKLAAITGLPSRTGASEPTCSFAISRIRGLSASGQSCYARNDIS